MRTSRKVLAFAIGAAFTVVAGACSRGVDLDKVTPGTEVTLTRQDGGVVKGPVERVEPTSVVVHVGDRSKTVPRSEITTVQVDTPGEDPAALPPAAKFREFVVAAGTPINAKLTTALASNTSHVDDEINAELSEPIVIDGVTVLPAGAKLSGVVVRAEASGKVKGLASLAGRFESIRADDQSYPVAMTFASTAQSTKGSDAKKIGIPAAGGAVIGGILGGKKGAAIGGAIGGGAGAAVVLSTSGKEVVLPTGTPLKLALDRDLDVKLPIK